MGAYGPKKPWSPARKGGSLFGSGISGALWDGGMSDMAALDQTRQEKQIEVGGVIFVTEYFDLPMRIEKYASWDDLFGDHNFTDEQAVRILAHPYTAISGAGGNFATFVRAWHVIALNSDGDPIDPEPDLARFFKQVEEAKKWEP